MPRYRFQARKVQLTREERERMNKLAKEDEKREINPEYIGRSHLRGLQISESDITEKVEGKKWEIKSQTSRSEAYEVCRQDITCTEKYESRCHKCKICIHQYVCSCPDYTNNDNICKHIHAVVQLHKQQQRNKRQKLDPSIDFRDSSSSESTSGDEQSSGDEIYEEYYCECSRMPNAAESILHKLDRITSIIFSYKLNKKSRKEVKEKLDVIMKEFSNRSKCQ